MGAAEARDPRLRSHPKCRGARVAGVRNRSECLCGWGVGGASSLVGRSALGVAGDTERADGSRAGAAGIEAQDAREDSVDQALK